MASKAIGSHIEDEALLKAMNENDLTDRCEMAPILYT
jgi:hypothetical protein